MNYAKNAGKISTWMLLFCGLVWAALASLPTAATQAADDAPAAGPEPVEVDMHEFMEYVFEPSYKRLGAALAAKPADRKAWKAIKGDALTLAEASNLLFDRAPKVDAKTWNASSAASRDSAGLLYQAAKQGDLPAATAAWTKTLQSCNQCHEAFAEDHILPVDGE